MKSTIKKYRQSLNAKRAKPLIMQAGFWFVDVPRTSSTSIKAELGARFGRAYGKIKAEGKHSAPQLINDHVTAQSMRLLLGQEAWNRIYTFSVVRNPWDRIASLFRYCTDNNKIPLSWTFSEYVERLASADERRPYFRFHGLRYGAVDFLTDSTGKIIIDDVVKYENRDEELKGVAEKLKFPELGHLYINKSKEKKLDYRKLYNNENKNIVGDLFEKDCRYFNYDF